MDQRKRVMVDDQAVHRPRRRDLDRVGDCAGDKGEGMTNRDYFAAKAMQAIIGCYKNTLLGDRNFDDSHDFSTFARDIAIDKNGQTSENEGCNEVAQDAYAFADAMLKARNP